MKKLFSLSVLIVILLTACARVEEVAPECYSNNPISELSWLKTVVSEFQKPKSGPLLVSSYSFRSMTYLVVANPGVSCPACYIYNCEGKTIAQLGIKYDEFVNEGTLIETFLNETY
jgi:hypothetical protein